AAGTIELGIAGGYSVSLNNEQVVLENGQIVDLKTVYGIHGLLRVGWLVTDEHGPSLLRGNLELTLEPTYIHLDSETSANVYGGALLARWLFAGNGNIRPYLQGGAGVIGGCSGLRHRASAGEVPPAARPRRAPLLLHPHARCTG